jgi:hypothetical protein
MSFNSTISVKLEVKDLRIILNVLNVYGPYTDIIPFWENLFVFGALDDSHILLGGDMNLTLSLREVWGASPQ